MASEPKVIFLHIPKTAGQSVHELLLANFDSELVCPARVNEQLKALSDEELNRYQVFSGHFDWNAFDGLRGERFVFTILRDPIQRLLSFYFYLREQAEYFASRGQLGADKAGLKAAYELTPWDYFVDPELPLRGFIDNHYDNFYTYYFAGRSYSARTQLRQLLGPGRIFRDEKDLVRLARGNLAELDAVLPLERCFDVAEMLSAAVGRPIMVAERVHLNVGKTTPESRWAALEALGAGEEVFSHLRAFCEWDNLLLRDLPRFQ